ncbi:DUF4398 domain-containing protein [Paucibacter soli]|uniref:DUF4398 domain-containing protein n=1 Tax=Paucibacter soli TaxID=3133433 RepID=UPI0030A09561
MRTLSVFALSGLLILALAACASTPPPAAEMALGKAAMGQALSAGGNEYAPAEMRMARDKLERAQIAINDKQYAQARLLAEEAQVDARLAQSKSEAGKAGKAAMAVKEDGRVLREELERKAP